MLDSNFTTLTKIWLVSVVFSRSARTAPTLVTPCESRLSSNDANGGGGRHTCVVRKVDTFVNRGPANRGAGELRQNGNAAQGVDGFSVPSLLNIGMGAPYLHHGAAESLEQLLDPTGSFQVHLKAGSSTFAPSAIELRQLIAFLRTVDDDTTPFFAARRSKHLPTDGACPLSARSP